MVAFLALGARPSAGQQPSPPSAQCLSQLHGDWVGPGRVMGRDIVMRQRWRATLQNSFTELDMAHLTAGDTSRAQFAGRGFYRPASGDSVTGTWFDSRGISFELRGSCQNGALTMRWLGVERGETRYTRRGADSLEVIDQVETNGTLRPFGRSLLSRQGQRATPAMVGAGVISTAAPEFAISISPDGRELWFNRASADRSSMTLMVSRRGADGNWGTPSIASFSGPSLDVDPFITPDGRRLYWSSTRPRAGGGTSFSTWYVERTADGWSAPIDPGAPMNSDSADVFVSASRDGDVVFSSERDGTRRFYLTRQEGGRWRTPVALALPEPQGILNPMLSPSGRYLVYAKTVPGRAADLFVACRTATGFDAGRPLSDAVNGRWADFAPSFSSDERTLYFTSERPGVVGPQPDSVRPPGDIYQIPWVDVAPQC
jgi:hypothetical protein